MMVLSKSFSVLKSAVTPEWVPPAIDLPRVNSRLTTFGLIFGTIVGGAVAAVFELLLSKALPPHVPGALVAVRARHRRRRVLHADSGLGGGDRGEVPRRSPTTVNRPRRRPTRRRRIRPGCRRRRGPRQAGGRCHRADHPPATGPSGGGRALGQRHDPRPHRFPSPSTSRSTPRRRASSPADATGGRRCSRCGGSRRKRTRQRLGTRVELKNPPRIIVIATTSCCAIALLAAIFGNLFGAVAAGLVGSGMSAIGKVCLDSTIQDGLPEQSRASAFGRSETVLQFGWCSGPRSACCCPPRCRSASVWSPG